MSATRPEKGLRPFGASLRCKSREYIWNEQKKHNNFADDNKIPYSCRNINLLPAQSIIQRSN